MNFCRRHWYLSDYRPFPFFYYSWFCSPFSLCWHFGQHFFVWKSHILFSALDMPSCYPLNTNSDPQSPWQPKTSPYILESFWGVDTTFKLIMVVSFSFPNYWSAHVTQCNCGWKIWVCCLGAPEKSFPC